MEAVIAAKSVAYWIHLCRRILPHSIGDDKAPHTAALVRAHMEAAIQKYGALELQGFLANSIEIPIERILGGLLLSDEFAREREVVQEAPQLVLTEFGVESLREYYDLERLAYEIWRSSAQLRAIGKGALLEVGDAGNVEESRSEDLDELISRYDARLDRQALDLQLSASGTVFPSFFDEEDFNGVILLPHYNVGKEGIESFAKMLRSAYGVNVVPGYVPNFIWAPYNLRGFLEAHNPFAETFEEVNDVGFHAVVGTLAADLMRVTIQSPRDMSKLRYWKRAYEIPRSPQLVAEDIAEWMPGAKVLLGTTFEIPDRQQIDRALDWLRLCESTQRDIDIAYPGPHKVLIPVGENIVFDYAWVFRRLYDFFRGVQLDDQNFKGSALEQLTASIGSPYGLRTCRKNGRARKEIDAAFAVDEKLVIVECRARSESIGFHRGDPTSIRWRMRHVVEKSLQDVDDKASWLASNPVGDNYDIRQFHCLLPVAVSPFVEFIPSLRSHYWLSNDVPRIMTPAELRALLQDNLLVEPCWNEFAVNP